MSTHLSRGERLALEACEVRIGKAIAAFLDVGEALQEIQSGALYRETHGTFRDYVRDRWGMTDRHARRLIAIAEALRGLDLSGGAPSFRQAEALHAVDGGERQAVWGAVLELERLGQRRSARLVRAVAAARCGDGDDQVREALVRLSQLANAVLDVLAGPFGGDLDRRVVGQALDDLRLALKSASRQAHRG